MWRAHQKRQAEEPGRVRTGAGSNAELRVSAGRPPFVWALLVVIVAHWIGFALSQDDPRAGGFRDHRSLVTLISLATALYGTMLLGSIYMVAGALRARITLFPDRIRLDGVFRSREMRLDWIEKIKWQHTGAFKLIGTGAKLTIDLHPYDAPTRLHLIRIFRAVLPEENQTGWPEFCYRNALGARKRAMEADKPVEPPSEGQVVMTRSRIDRLFAILFLPFVLFSIVAAIWTGESKLLFSWLAIVPIWLLIRFVIPKKGYITDTLSSEPGGRFKACGLMGMPLSFVAMAGGPALGLDRKTSDWLGIAIALAALCAVIRGLMLENKQRRKKIAEAPAEWERLESGLDNSG